MTDTHDTEEKGATPDLPLDKPIVVQFRQIAKGGVTERTYKLVRGEDGRYLRDTAEDGAMWEEINKAAAEYVQRHACMKPGECAEPCGACLARADRQLEAISNDRLDLELLVMLRRGDYVLTTENDVADAVNAWLASREGVEDEAAPARFGPTTLPWFPWGEVDKVIDALSRPVSDKPIVAGKTTKNAVMECGGPVRFIARMAVTQAAAVATLSAMDDPLRPVPSPTSDKRAFAEWAKAHALEDGRTAPMPGQHGAPAVNQFSWGALVMTLREHIAKLKRLPDGTLSLQQKLELGLTEAAFAHDGKYSHICDGRMLSSSYTEYRPPLMRTLIEQISLRCSRHIMWAIEEFSESLPQGRAILEDVRTLNKDPDPLYVNQPRPRK